MPQYKPSWGLSSCSNTNRGLLITKQKRRKYFFLRGATAEFTAVKREEAGVLRKTATITQHQKTSSIRPIKIEVVPAPLQP